MDAQMPEHLLLGFELANEHAKQLITVSTGVLAITITYLVDRPEIMMKRPVALKLSWVLHLFSVVFGIMAMSGLTGTLAPMDPGAAAPVGIGAGARICSGLQLLTFMAGTACITWFGWVAAHHAAEEARRRGAQEQGRGVQLAPGTPVIGAPEPAAATAAGAAPDAGRPPGRRRRKR